MAKAGTKPKRKPKTTTSDKEQSERFIETARQLGVDDAQSGEVFKRAFEKIVPQRRAKESQRDRE
jgi:hypothetical protein